MMSVKEHMSVIGREGLLAIQSLKVKVLILDVRSAFGRIDYQVRPVQGSGEQWIESGRVQVL
jgi:hypothetical protein